MRHRSRSCYILLFALMYGAVGCKPKAPPKEVDRAFYFWRSGSNPKAGEFETLKHLHVDRVYVKFFDVMWDREHNEARPVAMARMDSTFLPRPTEIVPVVFLAEEALAQTDVRRIPELARNVSALLGTQMSHLYRPVREIQFDCDWTLRTKEKYFLLLTLMEDTLRHAVPDSIQFSTTIRLHQVKYRARTGVPPVDRGMLMFYNMTDWRTAATQNSILDLEAGSRYTDYIHDYPLPFDVALPIFRWTLAYRNDRFLTILNSIDRKDVEAQPFVKEEGSHRFRVIRDTALFGMRFRAGDLLRTEECTSRDLFEAEHDILPRIRNTSLHISLYHLDSASLSHYPYETLDSLFTGHP